MKSIAIDGVEYVQRTFADGENRYDRLPQYEPTPEVASDPADSPAPRLADKSVDWTFLKSTRFWSAVIASLSIYAETKGWIGEPERNLISIIAASFVTVGTLDRLGKNL